VDRGGVEPLEQSDKPAPETARTRPSSTKIFYQYFSKEKSPLAGALRRTNDLVHSRLVTLVRIIANPYNLSIAMHPQDYAQLLYEVLQNKSPAQQDAILSNFKKILIKNKEAYLAPAIEKELDKIQAQKEQEKITYISSAAKLSASQQKELESISSEPREFLVNPELLGGLAVRSKDAMHNATLRKKISLLKNVLAF